MGPGIPCAVHQDVGRACCYSAGSVQHERHQRRDTKRTVLKSMYHRRIPSSACPLETKKRETKPAGIEVAVVGWLLVVTNGFVMADDDMEGEVTKLEVGD